MQSLLRFLHQTCVSLFLTDTEGPAELTGFGPRGAGDKEPDPSRSSACATCAGDPVTRSGRGRGEGDSAAWVGGSGEQGRAAPRPQRWGGPEVRANPALALARGHAALAAHAWPGR